MNVRLTKPTWTVRVQTMLKSGKTIPAVAWSLQATDAFDAAIRAMRCASHTGLPANPVVATFVVEKPVRL